MAYSADKKEELERMAIQSTIKRTIKEIEINKYQALEYSNVELNNFALIGTDNEEIPFYINTGKNEGNHTIMPTRGRPEIVVKAKKFSDVLSKTKATKVKMDIEGAEWDILSKDDIDWSGVDAMVLEWHHKSFNKTKVEKYEWAMTYLQKHFSNVKSNLDLNKRTWYGIIGCYK